VPPSWPVHGQLAMGLVDRLDKGLFPAWARAVLAQFARVVSQRTHLKFGRGGSAVPHTVFTRPAGQSYQPARLPHMA